MSKMTLSSPVQDETFEASFKQQIAAMVDDHIARLPDIEKLTNDEIRGIIARYSSVLEGNFIYWMTATYLAIKCEEAREIIIENLTEEVRDSHPAMLRKFAIAANAFPTDVDALAVNLDLTNVRLFLGKMQGVQSLATMAFFESYIQRFMSYLADLAAARGSAERVYTDVHGVCDIEHSEGLLRAVSLEMAINPMKQGSNPYEGVELLCALLNKINHGTSSSAANRHA
ncbi:MAG: iron-containing redox enzyme family protein [Acidobacteriaceae bacterium]